MWVLALATVLLLAPSSRAGPMLLSPIGRNGPMLRSTRSGDTDGCGPNPLLLLTTAAAELGQYPYLNYEYYLEPS